MTKIQKFFLRPIVDCLDLLKVPAGKTSWDAPFFMPVVEDCTDLTMTGVQLVQPGGVDYKWRVTEAGNYRITLDIDALTISFEKR